MDTRIRLLPVVLLSGLLIAGLLASRHALGRSDENRQPPSATGPSALVQVSKGVRVSSRDVLVAYGTVEFTPEDAEVVDLGAERAVVRVHVAAGQTVRKGEPLITVRMTPAAQLELERARLDVAFARADVDRLSDLRARELATNAQVQSAEAHLARAEAMLASVLKRLGGPEELTLYAKTDGVVQSVGVHQGDIVAPHVPLLQLARGDRLRVPLGIEPADLERVHAGQTVEVAPVSGHGARVRSHIVEVYRQVDPTTRLAEVVVPLGRASHLLPGSMVRGRIALRKPQEVLAIPRSAVLYRSQRPYVYVVVKGRAVRRWIEVGRDDGPRIEVRKGLDLGTPVVTLGNYELTDGMSVRLAPGSR